MRVVQEVQNAGHWISRDTIMAQSVVPAASPDPDGFPLTLTWYGFESSDEHQVVYTLTGDQIQREHYTNSVLDTTKIVARHIDSSGTNCQFINGKLTLTVTASLSGYQPVSETRTYEADARIG
jgi:hypothetical protein